MIYWLLCYPHEPCYIPNEHMGYCYQARPREVFIDFYTDEYTFENDRSIQTFEESFFGRLKRDDFDKMCSSNENIINHAKKQLKGKLEKLREMYPRMTYAAVLHNKDFLEDGVTLAKPHFHIYIENSEDVEWKQIFDLLGMYKYKRCDFDMRGKHYIRYERDYLENGHPSRIGPLVNSYRSEKLRYLCHIGKLEKAQYSPISDVITNFDYANDSDVLNESDVEPFAKFLSYAKQYNLRSHWQWLEWFHTASRKILPEGDKKAFDSGKIRTDIKSYYISKSVDIARGYKN